MPVSVYIPAKFRLDPEALFNRHGCIEQAFDQALGRALRKSESEVLAARGSYVGVKLHPPEFQWSGDGLERVPARFRARTEAAIAARILQSAEEARIYARARASRRAPDPVPRDVSESVDWQRDYGRLGLYEIPSYNGGGDTVEIPVEIHGGGDDEIRYQWRAIPAPSRQDIVRLFAEATRIWGNPTEGAYIGVIWETSTGYTIIMQARAGGGFKGFEMSFPQHPELDANGNWVARTLSPGPGIVVAERLGAATTREQRIAIVRRVQGAAIRADLEKHIPRAARSDSPQAQQAMDRAVTAEVERRAGAFPDGTVSVAQIDFGGQPVLLPLPAGDQYEWDGEAYLLPVADEAPASEGEEGPGGAGGPGAPGGAGGHGRGGRRGGDGAGTGEGGGFVTTGEDAADGQQGALFPSAGGEGDTLECEAFQDEPSLDDLGPDGDSLRTLMEEIAYALQMPMCQYPGNFCINAARTLNSRAGAIGEYAAQDDHEGFFQEITRPNSGNLGSVNFIPLASPAIQLLRHLAGVTPLISRLSNAIESAYTRADRVYDFGGREPISWVLHFFEEVVPAIKAAVAVIFIAGCRVLMLQLLNSSYKQIQARLTNLDSYSSLFERVLIPRLTGLTQLMRLRDRLQRVHDLGIAVDVVAASAIPGGGAVQASSTWRQAQQALVESLAVRTTSAEAEDDENYGQLVRNSDGSLGIRGRNNHVWSMEGLEQAITMMRGTLEGIDPLIKQLTDLEDVMSQFQETSDIRSTLRQVLQTMSDSNEEITSNVRDKFTYAFRASKIHSSLPSATVPGTEYALQGIHLQTHQQLNEFFRGDGYYALGLDYLFGVEEGRREILSFIEFAGIVALCVLCPPVGIAAGIADAAWHYEEAREAERVYQSLIDPELVITRAEVETQLFAAELGLALSFLPVAGAAGKGAASGVRLLATYGLEEGGEIITTSIRSSLSSGVRGVAGRALGSLTTEVAEALERGFVQAFVIEMAKAETINLILGRAMQPVMERIVHNVAVRGPVGGPAAVRQIIAHLAAQRADRRRSQQ